MKIFYRFLASIVALTAFAVLSSSAYADCQPIYGGGQTCTTYSFSVQKLVQTPGKGGGNFVNNLSVNDPKYSPSQTVNFEIIVQNTGSQTIPTLNVVDTLPQYVKFVSGSGNYDSNSNTLSFTINNINPGQSLTYNLTTQIVDPNFLPSNQGIMCPVNQVNAKDTNGFSVGASSQFCLQRTPVATLPVVTSTPATGPEMLPLFALLPGALGGLILRKKSYKSGFKGGEK